MLLVLTEAELKLTSVSRELETFCPVVCFAITHGRCVLNPPWLKLYRFVIFDPSALSAEAERTEPSVNVGMAGVGTPIAYLSR
jgi:hypothetical protein